MKDFVKNNTLVVIIIAVLLAGAAIGLGSFIENRQAESTTDQAFIEAMIPHHESAIQMAELAQQRAELPELQTLSTAIIKEQQQEIAQMQEWYRQWFGTAVPKPTLENIADPADEHGGHGQASGSSEADALRMAENFDLEFVRSMIRHHEGTIEMAENVLPQAEHQEVKDLARAITASQAAEIDEMRELETNLQD